MFEDLIKNFRDFVKKKGLKYTSEREEILQEILNLEGHFDVEELYLRLREKNKKISKASIYRSIPLYIEAGYIQEVYRQDGHSHYELTLNKAPHLHFICLRCGKVEEVVDQDLERLIKQKEREKGFKLLTHHLESFGLCDNCNQAEFTTLATVEKGQVVEVIDLPLDAICQKLLAMGLRKGELLKILQICGRTLLVELKNSKLVINKELASKIPVKVLRKVPIPEEMSCEVLEKEGETICLAEEKQVACESATDKGCAKNFLVKIFSKV